MKFYYCNQFFTDLPLDTFPLNKAILDELEARLLKLLPKWVQYILRKWPNHYIAHGLTGIKIHVTTNTNEPGKITAEIWKDYVLKTSVVYTKETYITEIEGKANKNQT